MTISHRLVATESEHGYEVHGYRCPETGATSASYVARFPGSSAESESARFPGIGTVWSASKIRIPNGSYPADRNVVFLDLDNGPRILCEAPQPIAIGARARIHRLNEQGDPVVIDE